MRSLLPTVTTIALFGATGLAASSANLTAAPIERSASPQSAAQALAAARTEAARARERAALLDRQAQAASQASDRATFEAAALGARVQQAEAALAGAEAALGVVKQQRATLDMRLAEQQAPATQLVAGLQNLVRRPALLTLAQPGSIQDAVHLRAVIAAVEPQIQARTATLRAELARARSLEQEAGRLAANRKALQANLMSQRGRLATLSTVELLKSRRAAGAADREAERAFTLAEQASDLTGLVRRLRTNPPAKNMRNAHAGVSRAKNTEPGSASLGPYRLPVSGAQFERTDGGITLSPRPGALAVAPAAGRVAFAGPYRGYGTIVIIEHSDGWTSLVTGLASAQVAIGQAVIAGSPLGLAPSRAPRIRLELRRNGERVNPLDQMR